MTKAPRLDYIGLEKLAVARNATYTSVRGKKQKRLDRLEQSRQHAYRIRQFDCGHDKGKFVIIVLIVQHTFTVN